MDNKISKLLQEFSGKFLDEVKNPYEATPNTKIITESVPRLIRDSLGLGDEYKVYGTVGKGNWAEIPWFAVLDKSITKSTTKGYYVVALFDKGLQDLYLCLGVGYTQFEEEFGIREGKLKTRAICDHYAKLLQKAPAGFKKGLIDLHADNNLGKGYEVGEIITKKYSVGRLTDQEFIGDLTQLMDAYSELKGIVGNNILNLEVNIPNNDETVGSFKKKIAAETLSEDTLASMVKLIEAANETPPSIRQVLKREIVRNKKFADFVKKRAKYICEICERRPFIQINGKPYAEADHIIPLGGESRGLDTPDNMRCLCAQCHAILTRGSKQEVSNLLKKKKFTRL